MILILDFRASSLLYSPGDSDTHTHNTKSGLIYSMFGILKQTFQTIFIYQFYYIKLSLFQSCENLETSYKKDQLLYPPYVKVADKIK